tara:strand:+ start:549 stop:1322 length:774 start_codon:yes stop_codon:yes gene_type:complete
MNSSESIPKELQTEFSRTNEMIMGFIEWMHFCILDTARDVNFHDNHLLSFLNQDILETLTGVLIHVKEGIHTPAIRESRYLLELSIKLAYVQQKNYSMPIDEKLSTFNKFIKSTSISPMKDIDLKYLKNGSADSFIANIGRLYGESSRFVHVTPESIKYRRNRIDNDRMLGKESETDIKELNDILQQMYAASIVFISHSIPQYVVGDWHVDSTGELKNWYYMKSRYVAEIDSTLDYKHERKDILERVKTERTACIAF